MFKPLVLILATLYIARGDAQVRPDRMKAETCGTDICSYFFSYPEVQLEKNQRVVLEKIENKYTAEKPEYEMTGSTIGFIAVDRVSGCIEAHSNKERKTGSKDHSAVQGRCLGDLQILWCGVEKGQQEKVKSSCLHTVCNALTLYKYQRPSFALDYTYIDMTSRVSPDTYKYNFSGYSATRTLNKNCVKHELHVEKDGKVPQLKEKVDKSCESNSMDVLVCATGDLAEKTELRKAEEEGMTKTGAGAGVPSVASEAAPVPVEPVVSLEKVPAVQSVIDLSQGKQPVTLVTTKDPRNLLENNKENYDLCNVCEWMHILIPAPMPRMDLLKQLSTQGSPDKYTTDEAALLVSIRDNNHGCATTFLNVKKNTEIKHDNGCENMLIHEVIYCVASTPAPRNLEGSDPVPEAGRVLQDLESECKKVGKLLQVPMSMVKSISDVDPVGASNGMIRMPANVGHTSIVLVKGSTCFNVYQNIHTQTLKVSAPVCNSKETEEDVIIDHITICGISRKDVYGEDKAEVPASGKEKGMYYLDNGRMFEYNKKYDKLTTLLYLLSFSISASALAVTAYLRRQPNPV